ncbi:hypothetical protein [Halostreptopolyspora alba]|uniref:Uncharacterized protein n=1 Tax=Halostreptopolyspora alba TaxID=2487137 RepID=A0A3N0DYL7_9ACTN|nr:hypothetical protein EFW17_22480 [Nocardiopsaceae bacterium YIM 96095]
MSITDLSQYRRTREAAEASCPEGCGHRLYRPTADEAEVEMTTHRMEVHASPQLRAAIAAELESWRAWIGEVPSRLVYQLVTERLAGRTGYTTVEGVA